MSRKERPSIDAWLRETREHPDADKIGMILTHNGLVRATPKAMVRDGVKDAKAVVGMAFSYDEKKLQAATQKTLAMPGIYCVRAWLNEGRLQVGDDLMLVLIGGDIRPHVVDALEYLVGTLKSECVAEEEIYI